MAADKAAHEAAAAVDVVALAAAAVAEAEAEDRISDQTEPAAPCGGAGRWLGVPTGLVLTRR